MPSAPEPPPLPPRYEGAELIGDGATGEVFLAVDTQLGVDVAVKVVRKAMATHRRFRSRFFKEVAISASLVHRHLVPVHDLGTLSDGRPYVVLAYADYGSLRDLFRRGFVVADLLEYAEQVCLGLGAMHARGVVHQDLKPANILLHLGPSGRPEVWVADLGVADELGQIARDVRRVGGTPTYMAPEQLDGRPQDFGPWTDLYALGLILWEALCGRRPHPGDSRKGLLEARTKAPPELDPLPGVEVPFELEALILNLLDPEPRQRYDRAADVRRALQLIRARMARRSAGAVDSGGDTDLTDVMDGEDLQRALLARLREPARPELRWHKVPPEPLPQQPPKEEPQTATSRASLPLFALREVPMVARDGLVQAIWRQARQVVTQRAPRVVLVVGPQGSGKTRLVEHLARLLDEGGFMEAVRLRYQEPPAADDGYIGAVRELLCPWNDSRQHLQRRLARWLARDRETRVEQVQEDAAGLARWCGYLLPGEAAPHAALGLRFLYDTLRTRAWRGGSCLVLDDVHACEESGDGLDIAEALLERTVGRIPVLVLATVSQEALARPALAAQVAALTERGALRLDLPPLDAGQITELLRQALSLDEALARVVARRVERFPLLSGVLLRQAAARGVLIPGQGGQFRLQPGVSIADVLPVQLHELYARRLQSAVDGTEDPATAAEALALVALAGQSPPVAIVRDIADQGLDLLLGAGLLREEAGLLRFEHGALQRTARKLAGRLPDRVELHERLAAAWERHGESTGADVDLPLGSHLFHAGRAEAAAPPLLRSTRALLAQGRHAAAWRSAELAIAAADASATAEHPALHPRAEARRLCGLALLELGQPDAADRVAQAAAALGTNDRLGRARLTLLSARAAQEAGRPEPARRLLRQAATELEALNDRDGLAEVLLCEAALDRSEHALDNARRACRRALELRGPEHPLGVRALVVLASAALDAGDAAELARCAEALERAAAQSGDTRADAQAAYAHAMSELLLGHPEPAERALRAAMAHASVSGDRATLLRCVNALGELARAAGERGTARTRYQECAVKARRWGLALAEAVASINLALMALEDRDLEQADQEARRAAEALALQPRAWGWLYVACVRAAVAAVGGQEAAARQWWSLALERGLMGAGAAELSQPLALFAEHVGERGWRDLEEQAWRAQAQMLRTSVAD